MRIQRWIKATLQNTEPWCSPNGIDRGERWFDVIARELRDSTIGIICLTKANRQRPWILWEAGAIAASTETPLLCTVLIDLDPRDIAQPLGSFNHTNISGNTEAQKSDLFKLVCTLNSKLKEPLRDEPLQDSFEAHLPLLLKDIESMKAELYEDEKVDDALTSTGRSDKEVLDEILETVRRVEKQNKVSGRGGQPIGPKGIRAHIDPQNDLFDEFTTVLSPTVAQDMATLEAEMAAITNRIRKGEAPTDQ